MMKIGGRNTSGEGPIIRMSNAQTHGSGGIECCFFRCCTCIHLEFLRTFPGLIKASETILSGLIQSLLINYGLRYSATIGVAFEGAITTSSACFSTSAILLICYVFSEKSYKLIRASLFEVIFNIVSCFFYLSSALYLAFSTKVFLWPIYVVTSSFYVYHAMTAAYLMSGIAGLLYGVDAYYSLKDFGGET